jgi:hypothetical protein
LNLKFKMASAGLSLASFLDGGDHRAELTKTERDENLAEWVKITERLNAQVGHKIDGRGRPEGGIAAASTA